MIESGPVVVGRQHTSYTPRAISNITFPSTASIETVDYDADQVDSFRQETSEAGTSRIAARKAKSMRFKPYYSRVQIRSTFPHQREAMPERSRNIRCVMRSASRHGVQSYCICQDLVNASTQSPYVGYVRETLSAMEQQLS